MENDQEKELFQFNFQVQHLSPALLELVFIVCDDGVDNDGGYFLLLVVMEAWLMRVLVAEVGVDVDGVWLKVGILVEKEPSVNKALVGESG